MKKLLILSTLLLCLTANNKTFSAEEEKQYRLIFFYNEEGVDYPLRYAIAEPSISEEKIKQSLRPWTSCQFYNKNDGYFVESFESKREAFSVTKLKLQDIREKAFLVTREEIKKILSEHKPKVVDILRIKDHNIKKITVKTEEALKSNKQKKPSLTPPNIGMDPNNSFYTIEKRGDNTNTNNDEIQDGNNGEELGDKTNTNNREKPSGKANKYFNKFNFGVFVIVVLIVVAVAAFIPKGKKSSNENKNQ